MIIAAPNFSFSPHPIYPWTDRIVVDGVLDEGSIVNGPWGRLRVKVDNPAIAERLFEMQCSELNAHFEGVSLPISNAGLIKHAYLYWHTSPSHPEPTVEFEIPLDLRAWCHPWTPVDFIDCLREVASEHSSLPISIRDVAYLKSGQGYVAFPISAARHGARVREVVETYLPVAVELLKETSVRLQFRAPGEITLSFSRFPERISFFLQQYLLYSFQFLCDLGIEANSSIKHEEHEVLFRYTPTARGDSLVRISEALQLYLRLPTEPEFLSMNSTASDIAFQDLNQAVHLLRERVSSMERHMVLQKMEEGTTSAAATRSKKDAEPLLGKFVTVRPIKFPPVEIELPQILRRLKRKMRG